MEAEAADVADRAHAAALVPRPGGMGAVFDDRDLAGDLLQGVQIDRPAGVMHRNDRPRAAGDLAADVLQVQRQGMRIDVGEDRHRQAIGHAMGRGDERHRGHDHFMPVVHVQEFQGQVQGGRAGIHRHGVGGADEFGELLFELRGFRPQPDPSRAQHFGNRVDLFLGHRRLEDLNHRGSSLTWHLPGWRITRPLASIAASGCGSSFPTFAKDFDADATGHRVRVSLPHGKIGILPNLAGDSNPMGISVSRMKTGCGFRAHFVECPCRWCQLYGTLP